MLRLKAKYRERNAKLVVEIFLGFQHIVLLREDGCDHFLCGGLADAARNADHGYVKSSAVLRRKSFHCLCNVRNHYDGCVDTVGDSLGKAANCAKPKGFGDIIVSVAVFALERRKHESFANLAAVYANA